MKYIHRFNTSKILENINKSEIDESVESCKDIIETFNEFEDEFKISEYRKGFKIDHWYGSSFDYKQKSENDKVALEFHLMPNKLTISSIYGKVSPTEDYFEIMSKTLSKAKSLSLKFKKYCGDTSITLHNYMISFLLVFDNIDDLGKSKAKFKRITSGLQECLSDWKTYKRVSLNLDNKSKDIFTPIVNMIKNHKETFNIGYGKEAKNLELKDISKNIELAFQIGESVNEEDRTITLQVSGFRWKTWYHGLTKMNLSRDEIIPIMNYISENIFRGYKTKEDKKDCDIIIKGQKIIIKVK